MSKFIAYSESGVTVSLNAKTELGAKREATKWLSYGAIVNMVYTIEKDELFFSGDVYIENTATGIKWRRGFWQNGHRFGWTGWEQIPSDKYLYNYN